MIKNWENETKDVQISEMAENRQILELIILIKIESPPNGRLTKMCEIRTPKRSQYTIELNLTSN